VLGIQIRINFCYGFQMSNIDIITQICYLIVVDKVADLPTFPDDP